MGKKDPSEAKPPTQPARESKGVTRDARWAVMQQMMRNMERQPIQHATANVPVTDGHQSAAYATGPKALQEGGETQPPAPAVFLRDHDASTAHLPRRSPWVDRLLQQRRALLIGSAAVGFVALLLIVSGARRSGTQHRSPSTSSVKHPLPELEVAPSPVGVPEPTRIPGPTDSASPEASVAPSISASPSIAPSVGREPKGRRKNTRPVEPPAATAIEPQHKPSPSAPVPAQDDPELNQFKPLRP